MNRRLLPWLAGGLSLAAIGWLLVPGPAVGPGAESSAGSSAGRVIDMRLRPDDASVLAVGEKVYASYCAACHGVNLQGQPDWKQRGPDGRLPAPPHDASGHTWHHADAVLFRITKYGVARASGLKDYDSAMQAYEGILTDAEIVAVLSWIKSQWPAEIRAVHDKINRQADGFR